jgi:Zn-finger nucleic acid-binding protein
MNCPKCNVTLLMTDRQGVEIDYCPQCRGIWLDRGELEKIIERSDDYKRPPEPNYPPQDPYHKPYPPQDHHHGHYGYKKKKGFFGEMFDF